MRCPYVCVVLSPPIEGSRGVLVRALSPKMRHGPLDPDAVLAGASPRRAAGPDLAVSTNGGSFLWVS